MIHSLPLYPFFALLCQHPDFSLGIAEYECALDILGKQPDKYFALDDPERKKLLNLCKLLWLKPNQNTKLFEKLFYLAYEETAKALTVSLHEIYEDANGNEQQDVETEESDKGLLDGNQIEAIVVDNEEFEQHLFLNFQSEGGTGKYSHKKVEKSFLFVQNFIPFQWRQLRQVWRFLKSSKGERVATDEIDINASLKRIVDYGWIIEPAYRMSKLNRAALITLIDCQGSMIAFKQISLAIAESAKLAGIKNSIFFFKNLPEFRPHPEFENKKYFVFKNDGNTKQIMLDAVMTNNPNAGVLIISDAGSAGSNYSTGRIKATAAFLREIYKYTLNVVWVNPMPENRWDGSSAYDIRKLTDMVEATPKGLKKGILIFKGKVKTNSNIVFPQIFD